MVVIKPASATSYVRCVKISDSFLNAGIKIASLQPIDAVFRHKIRFPERQRRKGNHMFAVVLRRCELNHLSAGVFKEKRRTSAFTQTMEICIVVCDFVVFLFLFDYDVDIFFFFFLSDELPQVFFDESDNVVLRFACFQCVRQVPSVLNLSL